MINRLTLLVLIDLGAFYHLNRSLAQIAGELGLSTMRKKYEPIANKDCPENLKSLYFAFAQYVEGNGSLPPADKWMENDEIASKVQKEEWFHCPEVSNRHDERLWICLQRRHCRAFSYERQEAERDPGCGAHSVTVRSEQPGEKRARCLYKPSETGAPWRAQ